MFSNLVNHLYERFRLEHYRTLFGNIKEKDGSLSATEAFAVDVIYLLKKPSIKQLSETLGISQPNATYKVNNLVAKGYVEKSIPVEDRRECRLSVAERFHRYYDKSDAFIDRAVAQLRGQFTPSEMETFSRVLQALNEAVE